MAQLVIESKSGQSDLVNTLYSQEVTWGSAIPKGMIAPFGTTSPPEGWLVCDGSTLNALEDVAFRDLFSVIGTTWGGTGEGDFKIPDLRGEFLRGADKGRAVDVGRTVGTNQDHGIPKLEGSVDSYYNSMYSSTGIFKQVFGDNRYGGNNGSGGRGFTFTSTDVIPDAPEVRPRNVAVLYCIKF